MTINTLTSDISIKQQFTNPFDKLVGEADSICLASHKCDEDATASLLTLYSILSERYPHKKYRIVSNRSSNERWRYLKYYDKIEFLEPIYTKKSQPDLLILLDTSSLKKLNTSSSEVQSHKTRTVCIDHHSTVVTDKFDLTLIDEEATSVVEILYSLYLHDRQRIPSHIAEAVLIGIVGDTAYLRYITPRKSYVLAIIQRIIRDQSIDLGFFLPLWIGYSERIYLIIQELVKNGKIERVGS